MSLSAKLRRAPIRIATGAFILNSGLGKLHGDEDTAKAHPRHGRRRLPRVRQGRAEDVRARRSPPARSRWARRCCCRSCPPRWPAPG